METVLKNYGNLIPVTKWNEYHMYPTIGALRALIFNAKKNKGRN